MTKKIELKAITRSKEETNTKEIRKSGFVPGILYGLGVHNAQLKLKKVELQKAFEKAGESSLIDLQIDDKASTKVIIKEVQTNRISGNIEHIDLFQVDMNKEIEVELPFLFINESKAEKEQGAMIMKNAESVLVKCLPGDLLEHLEIDLSKLENTGDIIRINDLDLPKSFEVLSDANEPVVSAIEHKAELEEVKPAVAEAPVADIKKEVKKEVKK